MGDNYTEVRYERLLDKTAAERDRLWTFPRVESSNEDLRCFLVDLLVLLGYEKDNDR